MFNINRKVKMNTEQNYRGKANYASSPSPNPQTAKTGPQSSLLPDSRQHQSVGFSREYVSVNKDVYEKQTTILATVFDFLGRDFSAVRAVNELLTGYLTRCYHQQDFLNLERVECLLELTTFVYDLLAQNKALEFCEDEVRKDEEAEEEVSND